MRYFSLIGGVFILLAGLLSFGDEALARAEDRSLNIALQSIKPSVERKLQKHFRKAHVAYPPAELTLIANKKEKKMELWARGSESTPWTYVRNYRIFGASGVLGPKLRQGDFQVPEGIYPIEYLNPNSRYHLSMKVGYPNAFDLQKAKEEGRSALGGDIFIHGNRGSRGCLSIGDKEIESLFTAVARTGPDRVKLVIAPNDLRRETPVLSRYSKKIPWVGELYQSLRTELHHFSTGKIFHHQAGLRRGRFSRDGFSEVRRNSQSGPSS